MKIEIQEILDLLRKQGWQEVPLPEEAKRAGLAGLCVSPFAALGLVVVSSTGEINSRWADCQVQMAQLRNQDAVGKKRDLYLAFVANERDLTAEARLQSILSDTHVCRKFYLAPNGLTVEEMIQGIPCLRAAMQTSETDVGKIVPLLETLNLPEALKLDLSKRSAAKILENLLTGQYQQAEKHK